MQASVEINDTARRSRIVADMRERTFVTSMIGLGLVMPIGLVLFALWTVVR